MTVHSKYPGYIKFDYHSIWGAHSQELSIKEWNPVPLVPGNALGSFTNWLGLPVDGQEMVEEFVDNVQALNIASTFYDVATVYTLASETAPAIPRASMSLAVPGTSVAGTWNKAVMYTYLMRDTAYNMAKLITLDTPIGASWDAITDISGSAATVALVGTLTSSAWAWSSKANLQIVTFTKLTYKLSDALRERYNMN